MISKIEPFETRYLHGTEYHFSENDLDNLDVLERNEKAKELLKANGIPLMDATYVKMAFTSTYQFSHWVVTNVRYKPEAFSSGN